MSLTVQLMVEMFLYAAGMLLPALKTGILCRSKMKVRSEQGYAGTLLILALLKVHCFWYLDLAMDCNV